MCNNVAEWTFGSSLLKPVLLAFGNKCDNFTKSFRKLDSVYKQYLPKISVSISRSQASFTELWDGASSPRVLKTWNLMKTMWKGNVVSSFQNIFLRFWSFVRTLAGPILYSLPGLPCKLQAKCVFIWKSNFISSRMETAYGHSKGSSGSTQGDLYWWLKFSRRTM
jgi:hypothetical protein